eukprot:1157470-Pelagomonas_calceolata.AAC.1
MSDKNSWSRRWTIGMHGFLGYSRLAAVNKSTYLKTKELTHGTAQQAPLLSHKSKYEGRAGAVCPRRFKRIAHYYSLKGMRIHCGVAELNIFSRGAE